MYDTVDGWILKRLNIKWEYKGEEIQETHPFIPIWCLRIVMSLCWMRRYSVPSEPILIFCPVVLYAASIEEIAWKQIDEYFHYHVGINNCTHCFTYSSFKEKPSANMQMLTVW